MNRAWVLAAVILALSIVPGRSHAGWANFTRSDGLASNDTYSIFEDRAGNLWVNSNGGLNRFDGVAWRVVPEIGSILASDKSKYLYAFTSARVLSRFDGVSWISDLPPLPASPRLSVRSAFVDSRGWIWIGDDFGYLARFDGSTWQVQRLPANYLMSIAEDHAGNIWVGSQGWGAFRFDGATWRQFRATDGLAGDKVEAIACDHEGNLWIGTWDSGLSRYDGVGWQTFSTAEGLGDNNVLAITVDRAGALWIGGYGSGGVTRFDGSTWRVFTTLDGLSNVSVSSILEDGSDNLWFTHPGAGLSWYDRSSWKSFTPTDGLPDRNYVDAVLEDHTGAVWIASDGGEVRRYGGRSWEAYPPASGLALWPLFEDRAETLWFRSSGGVSHFDGANWITLAMPGVLADAYVSAMSEDRAGNFWFGTTLGVGRFDGTAWRIFTVADGLTSDWVNSVLEDRAGNLWIGTENGVSRFDGTSWRTYTTAEGLADNLVWTILEDRAGGVWFGTQLGVSHYDGSSWRSFSVEDGLAYPIVTDLAEDADGKIWAGTSSGVSCYDGERWRTYTKADGLPGNQIRAITVDRSGRLWFGTDEWLGRHEPDRIAPRPVFVAAPQSPSASRSHVATFAAFAEARGIQFSTRLDGSPWSDWSSNRFWAQSAIPDGVHVLEVRALDYAGNISAPLATTFTVDGTPPIPAISSPPFGTAVRGMVIVTGTTADSRFERCRLEFQPAGFTSWDGATLLAETSAPITNGSLGSWDTSSLPDGGYDLRASVVDSVGLTGSAVTTVMVDNHAPFFDETAPAKVTAATGGDVYTTNAETHLYFPPHAFAQDAVVMVVPAAAGSVPATLPSGGTKVLDGYEIAWAGVLQKPARFTLGYAGATLPAGTLALYRSSDGTSWERLGGTLDAANRSLSLAVTLPGRYALFADNGLGAGAASLSPIAFTPRVFSPTGGFADQQVGISFRLGKPAPVTVKVFSKSGRLIREVATGQPLQAGENMIPWDGVDRNGGYVVDGVYLVTVEALGQTQTKTLAVVK